MGLLSSGTPLHWQEAQQHADYIRKHGVIQFLNIWNRLKSRRKDCLLWGDEIEYFVVEFSSDSEKKTATNGSGINGENGHAVNGNAHVDDETGQQEKARLPLKESWRVLSELMHKVHTDKEFAEKMDWKPEYGRYMLEGTPGQPYKPSLDSLLTVEPNMALRRKTAASMLPPNHEILTLTSPPMLGLPGCFSGASSNPTPLVGQEEATTKSCASGSLFLSDDVINPHPRFATLTRNIRQRRGSKVAINLPIFKDTNTPSPFMEPIPEYLKDTLKDHPKHSTAKTLPELTPAALPDHVYMDAMGFGMGCCCLQITFQACSVEEARRLYDQLAVVSPIMLALSAASPIFRGYLVDHDCRWTVISDSVDDRTPVERGQEPLDGNHGRKMRIDKSRYGSISSYLSPGPNYSGGCGAPFARTSLSLLPALSTTPLREHYDAGRSYWNDAYNDIPLEMDEDALKMLLDGGVDEHLARHIAHLFIRDPLVVYRESIDLDDTKTSEHFENIQSTNWQTMRFKPPPPSAPNMGWRVEFRVMDVQASDFENAALAIFILLLTRTILSFETNFYIPISKVDENLARAEKRDAVLNQKFWWRKDMFGSKEAIKEIVKQAAAAVPPHTHTHDHSDVSRGNLHPDMDVARQDSDCGCGGNSDSEVHETTHIHEASQPLDENAWMEMSVNDIINGNNEHGIMGLLQVVEAYLCSTNTDLKTIQKLRTYLKLIGDRASGAAPTNARRIREFVQSHPLYKHDSHVPDAVIAELCRKAANVGMGGQW